MTMKLTLPTDSAKRKEYGLSSFCDDYFPAALVGVARHSFHAGVKHTGGQPIHKRWLSTDHADCIRRHLLDLKDMQAHFERTAPPTEVEAALLCQEADALAWRALALSQELHEKFDGAPLAPAARLQPEPGLHTAAEMRQLEQVMESLR